MVNGLLLPAVGSGAVGVKTIFPRNGAAVCSKARPSPNPIPESQHRPTGDPTPRSERNRRRERSSNQSNRPKGEAMGQTTVNNVGKVVLRSRSRVVHRNRAITWNREENEGKAVSVQDLHSVAEKSAG